MSETITVISNAFSEDVESHGLTLFLVTLDGAYAAKLVSAIRSFDTLYRGIDLGEISRVLIRDAKAVFTEEDEEAGINDNFDGAFGILKADVQVPANSFQIAKSFLVITPDHAIWEAHTRDFSVVESQALPLDFLERVAEGDAEGAARLARRRKSFDERGRAVYHEQ